MGACGLLRCRSASVLLGSSFRSSFPILSWHSWVKYGVNTNFASPPSELFSTMNLLLLQSCPNLRPFARFFRNEGCPPFLSIRGRGFPPYLQLSAVRVTHRRF